MKTTPFYFKFSIPYPAGIHPQGWARFDAVSAHSAWEQFYSHFRSRPAVLYPEDEFRSMGEALDLLDDPPSAPAVVPMTQDELIAALQQIKPGEPFEVHALHPRGQWVRSDDPAISSSLRNQEPLDFIRDRWNVRPLPEAKFYLWFISQRGNQAAYNRPGSIQYISYFEQENMLRIQEVSAPSLSAASALAAPEPGETFLGAVPHP